MTAILITRPQPDAQILADKLTQKFSIPCVCEPLLQITPLHKTLTLDPTVTDIIVTSARVFDLIDNWADYVKKSIWCVGDVTAERAKEIGFKTIFCAHRSAQELLEKITKECTPKKSAEGPKIPPHFVHVSGDIVHLNVAEALTQLGFKAEQVILYKTLPLQEFSKKTIKLLKEEGITLAPFFSQRTAEIFVDLIKKQKGETFCQKIKALAHSEVIAQKLKALPWAQIHIVPDLGADTIAQYFKNEMKGPKAMISSPSNQSSLPSKSTPTMFIPIGSSILTAILTVLFMAIFGWFVVAPHFIEPLSIQMKALTQQVDHIIESVDKITQQQASQSLVDKSEWKQLTKNLSVVTDRLAHIELASPSQGLQGENHLISGKITSPEEKHQIIVSAYDHLLTSTLSPEEQNFLREQQISGPTDEDILSIPQLLTELAPLDFSIYADVPLPEKGMVAHLVDKFGIKIRQKSDVDLKTTITSSLQNSDFSFIKSLESHLNLPANINHWVTQCKKTQQVLEALKGQLNVAPTYETIEKTPTHEVQQ